MQKKELLLFTGEFPYGRKGEPFLEDEINFLALEFEKIYVFPQKKSDEIRETPRNVTIVDALVNNQVNLKKTNPIKLSHAFFAIIKESIYTKHGLRYLINLKHYLYYWLNSNLLSKQINEWLDKINPKNPTIYTYWSDNTLLGLSMIRKKLKKSSIVTRAHGFDLYDDRSIGNLSPFRISKYKITNQIHCISNHGFVYLKNKLPVILHKKLRISYLGVAPQNNQAYKNNKDEMPIILSCARMESFKRLNLIPDILKIINKPIHWVHFGDGPEFSNVEKKCKSLPPFIKISLMGQQPNRKVHDFYKTHNVHFFISLSLSEGLPVSMMEAISYGIPIIAVGVNGVPEIVTNTTGVLLKQEESIDSIAQKISVNLEKKPFSSDKIIDFYNSNFNSQTNYAKFAKEISEIE